MLRAMLCSPEVYAANPEWFVCWDHDNQVDQARQASSPPPPLHFYYPCPPSMINKLYVSQPCWSNASLVATLVSNVLSVLRANPTTPMVMVDQMDGNVPPWLVCKPDHADNARLNTTGGAMFLAVNAVAKAIEVEFPEVVVMTEAYEASQFPPIKSFQFNKNVVMRVALTASVTEPCVEGTGDARSRPLADPYNAMWVTRLQRFLHAAPRGVYTWIYETRSEYTLSPQPNYFVVAEDIEFLGNLGVIGWNGEGICCEKGTEMIELKTYLIGRKLFDPTLNVSVLTTEFLDGFYSPAAAPHIHKYLKLMDSSMRARGAQIVARTDCIPDYKDASQCWGPHAAMLDNVTVLTAAAHLKQAELAVAALDGRFQRRASRALIAVQFVALVRWQELRAFVSATSASWPLAATIEAEFDLFAAAFNASGLTKFSYRPEHKNTIMFNLRSFRDEIMPTPDVHLFLKSDDSCPLAHRELWNGLCQSTTDWPPNKPLTREVVTPAYLTSKPRIINVSIGRQLFVDSFLVQSSHGIKTAFHAPEYDEAVNPVLKSSELWEIGETAGGLAGTAKAVGVWWQPDKGHYEMFYRCGSHSLCVAYSADAITWTKPKIDNGFKSCGGDACNMVVEVGGIGNSAVWLDLDTANASRRYVLAASHTQIDFYTSATGTNFTYATSSGPVEDCTSFYKDLLRDKWVYSIKASGCSGRAKLDCTSPGRTRRYWEGDDVLADCQWGSISGAAPVKPGSPVQWMGSDRLDDANMACGYTPSLDKNNTQLYQFDAVAYESVLIGLFSIITGKRCSPPKPFGRGGEQDAVYIGFSRDGFNFQRSPVRLSAFLPMGTKLHSWNFRESLPTSRRSRLRTRLTGLRGVAENVRAVAGGFLTSKEKLRWFAEGKSGSCAGIPGCKPKLAAFDGNTSTGTATMRRDGFASIAPTSAAASGVLTTEPMSFGSPGAAIAGTFLYINVAVKAGGSLQVELLIDGTSKLSSTTIHGHTDSTKLMMRWANGSSSIDHWPPPSLAPQLRFTLQGGVELFAFWLTHDAKCGSSNGPVAGSGASFERGWDRRRDGAALCGGGG